MSLSAEDQKQIVLRLGAAYLAVGKGEGTPADQTMLDVREVFEPIFGDAEQLLWSLVYTTVVMSRVLRLVWDLVPLNAKGDPERDMVTTVVLAMMKATEDWET